MIEVRRLRLLRELAQRGTIAAVAEALAFTPSAVSQQLAVLQHEAGVALLERSGRRVILTPAGRLLVEHANAIIDRLEQADAELETARSGVGGPLRIGMFPSAGRTIVPAALADLERVHPRLEPMVTVIDPGLVGDALRSGELDVAVVHDYDFVPAEPDPTVATVALQTEPMYLACGRDDDPPEETSLRELLAPWRDVPWITPRPGTTGHTMVVRACQAAGFEPRIRHQINDHVVLLSFVDAGHGVGLVPEHVVPAAPAGVRTIQMPIHRRSRVAYRSGAARHPAIVALIAALRHVADGVPDR